MLRGRTVTLVPLDRTHMAKTRAWMNDSDIMRLMNRERLVSDAEHEAYFRDVVGRDDNAFFAIELADTGSHVGNVWLWGIDRHHRKAELRVVIGDAAARGKGAGAEAIDLLCRHAFDRLNLQRVYAYVLAINPAAKRAFEAAGFVQEGVLRDDRRADGAFVDAWLLARVKSS